ncbi:MAG: hypothetical protein WCG85_11025 [Polyangia bacterium]
MMILLSVLEIAACVCLVVITCLQLGLRSYAKEKGKDLATKEDIAAITREVEGVKAEYAQKLLALEHSNELILERTQQRHQLSLAALEQRLQVHQEAFARCYELREISGNQVTEAEAVKKLSDSCQWWRRNCLYLSPEASKAFISACNAAGGLLGTRRVPNGDREGRLWDTLAQASGEIAKSVKLPGISISLAEDPNAARDGQGT